MILSLILVFGGIAVLVYSANVLVESSSDLARYFGVSLAVVGAIIVGFGTSLPELAVSLPRFSIMITDRALRPCIPSVNPFLVASPSRLV